MRAILVNERGAEQKMVDMLQRRGIDVVRLLDQFGGRDDRQLLCARSGGPVALAAAAVSAPAAGTSVFQHLSTSRDTKVGELRSCIRFFAPTLVIEQILRLYILQSGKKEEEKSEPAAKPAARKLP